VFLSRGVLEREGKGGEEGNQSRMHLFPEEDEHYLPKKASCEGAQPVRNSRGAPTSDRASRQVGGEDLYLANTFFREISPQEKKRRGNEEELGTDFNPSPSMLPLGGIDRVRARRSESRESGLLFDRGRKEIG